MAQIYFDGVSPHGTAFNGSQTLVMADNGFAPGERGNVVFYSGFGELNPKLAFTANPQGQSDFYGLQIRPLAGPGGSHVELAFSIQVAYGTILRASTNLLDPGQTFNALFPNYQITETADQYLVTVPVLSQPCFFRLLPPSP